MLLELKFKLNYIKKTYKLVAILNIINTFLHSWKNVDFRLSVCVLTLLNIIGLSYNWHILMTLTIECSLLKMKYEVYIIH